MGSLAKLPPMSPQNRSLPLLASLLLVAGCHAETPTRVAPTTSPAPAAAPDASEANSPEPAPAPTAQAPVEGTPSPWCSAAPRASQERKHGVSSALAELNEAFLREHARARQSACAELESERLVLRYAFGTFEARYRGKDLLDGPVNLLPPEYHPIKDVSHAVLLAALLFQGTSSDPATRGAPVLDVLGAALAQLEDASSPTTRSIPSARLPVQKRILRATEEAVRAYSAGKLDERAQRAFFAKVRPDLDDNVRAVSSAFLRELHRRVEEVRRKVPDASAWQSVAVVVGAAHQARAREIGVQYFERLLSEPVGEGARLERRMVISESVFQPADQLGLLATHLVDQESGELVFGDPLRLQWDVLADHGGALDALLPPQLTAPPAPRTLPRAP